MPKPNQVFISHSSKDRKFVEREIIALLSDHGIKFWYSNIDIQTAEQWHDSILDGLKQSDWFLVVLSRNSIESEWVAAEVHWWIEERGNQLVPVLMEDCDWKDLHLKIRRIQHVDFGRDLEKARQRLLKVWGIPNGTAEVIDETGGQCDPLAVTEQDGEATGEWVTIQLAKKMYVVSEQTLRKSIRRGEIEVQDASTGATEKLLLKTENLDDKFYPRALLPLIIAGAAGGTAVSVVSAFINFLRQQLGASETEEPSKLIERFDEKYVGETAKQQLQRASKTYRASGKGEKRSSEPAKPLKVVTNSIGMKLKLIPAGDFKMGSPDSDKSAGNDEKPQHRVQITKPFFLGVYPVTQAEYENVMRENPSEFKGNGRRPVENVSWLNAIAFCNKLSEQEELQAYYRISGEVYSIIGGDGYRLPTEAEWEYACRAGSTTKWCFADDESQLKKYAWYDDPFGKTHPVGEKQPNQWGLHDMHGNVWEWCWDWYGEEYYKNSPASDPMGPRSGTSRVLRGGSFYNQASLVRSAYRGSNVPTDRSNSNGFRSARTYP